MSEGVSRREGAHTRLRSTGAAERRKGNCEWKSFLAREIGSRGLTLNEPQPCSHHDHACCFNAASMQNSSVACSSSARSSTRSRGRGLKFDVELATAMQRKSLQHCSGQSLLSLDEKRSTTAR